MSLNDTEIRDRLAAEYALGTLEGPARRELERRLAKDRDLCRRVAAWETRLGGLVEDAEPVEPPAEVWRGIRDRSAGRYPGRREGAHQLWSSLPFWRGLAVAALVLLMVVGGLALGPASNPGGPDRMVVVTNKASQPVWVVSSGGERGVLRVRTVRDPGMGPKQVCPLWLQWEDGKVNRMVAVLPEEPGSYRFRLPENMEHPLNQSRVAVTVEAADRIPAERPGGRMVFQSDWISL